ncbi:MAG: DUF3189 family protein [Halanaerobacter sp.]
MKIIFYSSGDNKLARLIGYSYLGSIAEDELTEKVEQIFLRDENEIKKNLSYLGDSINNIQIMALGCYGQNSIVINLVNGLNDIFSISEKIILINIDSIYNLYIKLGTAAINLKWERLGCFLLKKGINSEIMKINKLVEEIREGIVTIL